MMVMLSFCLAEAKIIQTSAAFGVAEVFSHSAAIASSSGLVNIVTQVRNIEQRSIDVLSQEYSSQTEANDMATK